MPHRLLRFEGPSPYRHAVQRSVDLMVTLRKAIAPLKCGVTRKIKKLKHRLNIKRPQLRLDAKDIQTAYLKGYNKTKLSHGT